MQKTNKVKVTILRKCPYYELGQEIIVEDNEFFRMMNDKFCTEAWQRISEYVHTAVEGGSNMQDWIKDEELTITCCNDTPDPMVYTLKRIYE